MENFKPEETKVWEKESDLAPPDGNHIENQRTRELLKVARTRTRDDNQPTILPFGILRELQVEFGAAGWKELRQGPIEDKYPELQRAISILDRRSARAAQPHTLPTELNSRLNGAHASDAQKRLLPDPPGQTF